jgi:serine/threonine protein kinase
MGCLDENTVLELFHGRMHARAASAVHAHLNECAECRQLVAEVSKAEIQSGVRAAGSTTLPLGGGIDPIAFAATTPASTDESSATRTFVPGTVIADRYRLDSLLGEGGTGIVWAATHMLLGRPIALKFLKAGEPHDVKRFLREAKISAMWRHPHIVEVHDVFELEDGMCVMVMERLSGESLRARFRRERALSMPDLARVLLPVSDALALVHAQGVVHRDLKPENVFLAELPDGAQTVKVLDFGLAKLSSPEGGSSTAKLTRTGALLGTPYYMAPEQVFAEKDIDARADLWALGVILYEGLSGVRPIEGESFGHIFRAITTGQVVPLENRVPGLPPAIADLSRQLLQRDRRMRLADVRVLREVLSPFVQA